MAGLALAAGARGALQEAYQLAGVVGANPVDGSFPQSLGGRYHVGLVGIVRFVVVMVMVVTVRAAGRR